MDERVHPLCNTAKSAVWHFYRRALFPFAQKNVLFSFAKKLYCYSRCKSLFDFCNRLTVRAVSELERGSMEETGQDWALAAFDHLIMDNDDNWLHGWFGAFFPRPNGQLIVGGGGGGLCTLQLILAMAKKDEKIGSKRSALSSFFNRQNECHK